MFFFFQWGIHASSQGKGKISPAFSFRFLFLIDSYKQKALDMLNAEDDIPAVKRARIAEVRAVSLVSSALIIT